MTVLARLQPLERKVAQIDDIYDSGDEQERLLKLMDQRWAAMLKAVHLVVQEAIPQWDGVLDDAATRRVLMAAAERVVRIDETTRRSIADMLQRGQALGLDNWSLAHGSKADDFPGIDGLYKERWDSRALTIARTEMQTAAVISAEDRYTATGLVDRVKIVDGDDDAPCAARNGKTVPLSGQPRPIHPNCTLLLVPILREGV